MSMYLLLIRGSNDEWNALSPEEMQVQAQRYFDWTDQLKTDGLLVDAQALADRGPVVRKGGTTVDGPYTETKEGVGGYYLIHAEDADAAARVAEGCPGLDHGLYVEVYPIQHYR